MARIARQSFKRGQSLDIHSDLSPYIYHIAVSHTSKFGVALTATLPLPQAGCRVHNEHAVMPVSCAGNPPVQGDRAAADRALRAHRRQAVPRRPHPLHLRRALRRQDRGHRRVLLDPRHLPPRPQPHREAEPAAGPRAAAHQQAVLGKPEPATRHVFLSVGPCLPHPPGAEKYFTAIAIDSITYFSS